MNASNQRMQRRPRSESHIVPPVPLAAPLMRDDGFGTIYAEEKTATP